MSHAHAIHFTKDIVGEIVLPVESQMTGECGTTLYPIEQAGERVALGFQKQPLFLVFGECPCPKHMRVVGRHERSVNESFQLVFQADFLVRYRPAAQEFQTSSPNSRRNGSQPAGVTISDVSNIAAE